MKRPFVALLFLAVPLLPADPPVSGGPGTFRRGYGQDRLLFGPSFSPDGKRIAFVSNLTCS